MDILIHRFWVNLCYQYSFKSYKQSEILLLQAHKSKSWLAFMNLSCVCVSKESMLCKRCVLPSCDIWSSFDDSSLCTDEFHMKSVQQWFKTCLYTEQGYLEIISSVTNFVRRIFQEKLLQVNPKFQNLLHKKQLAFPLSGFLVQRARMHWIWPTTTYMITFSYVTWLGYLPQNATCYCSIIATMSSMSIARLIILNRYVIMEVQLADYQVQYSSTPSTRYQELESRYRTYHGVLNDTINCTT